MVKAQKKVFFPPDSELWDLLLSLQGDFPAEDKSNKAEKNIM